LKHSIGKIIGGSLLGAIAGFFAPMTLLGANPAIGVAATWLYAWAGIVPAGVFAVTGMAVAHLLGGNILLAGYVLAVLVPAAAALAAIRLHKKYKTCMRISVFTQIGAVVLALGLAWGVLKTDLVDLLMSNMEMSFRLLPTEVLNAMFNVNSGVGGMLGRIELLGVLDSFLEYVEEVFKVGLAGMLLSNSILTGVLNVAVPVWVWARSGDERGIRRVPVSDWRVPESAAIGLPVCLLIGFILNQTGYPGGDAVYFAIQMVFQLFLQFQCMGVFSRYAKKSGGSMFMRALLVIGALTFASTIAVYIGAFSLYLGSQGLITTFIRNRKKNHGEDE